MRDVICSSIYFLSILIVPDSNFLSMEAFKKMLDFSPMGAVLWEFKGGKWFVVYANKKASRFLPFEPYPSAQEPAENFLKNLGKVDLLTLFQNALSLQKTQEVIVKHEDYLDRAHVFLSPLGERFLVSYYIGITPLIRMENELKMAINQLSKGNAYMAGRENQLVDLEEELKGLKLKLNICKKSLTFSHGK